MLTLHVFPPSPRAAKVLALADHLNLDYRTRLVDLFKGEQRTPGFAALNANQRMPVLEEDDFVLWESNAILQYLASKRPESGLWPSDARGQADVARWLHWESAHLTPACIPLAFERVVKGLAGLGAPDPKEEARGEQEFHKLAPVLNAHLRDRTWLVGDALTIADFGVGCAFPMSQAARYPLEGYPEITRWYTTLASLPAWKKAMLPPMA